MRGSEFIILGSQSPIGFDFDETTRRIQHPPLARDLVGIGIRSSFELVSHHLMTRDQVDQFCAPGPLNTDDLPFLEYRAPRELYAGLSPEIPEVALRASPDMFLNQYLRKVAPNVELWLHLLTYALADLHPQLITNFAIRVALEHPDHVRVLLLLASAQAAQDDRDDALATLRRAVDLNSADPGELEAAYSLSFPLEESQALQQKKGGELNPPPSENFFQVSERISRRLLRVQASQPAHVFKLFPILYIMDRFPELESELNRFEVSFGRPDQPFKPGIQAYLDILRSACAHANGRDPEALALLDKIRDRHVPMEAKIQEIYLQTRRKIEGHLE